MSQSLRYLDLEGWKEFNNFDGQEFHMEVILPLSIEESYDEWMHYCWKGMHSTIIEIGTGRSEAQGSHRVVPGRIHEKILRVAEPDGSNDNFPSITYKVISGPFPVDDHLGFVRFIPDLNNQTLVCWDVKFVPSSIAKIFCCGGATLRMVSRSYIQSELNAWRKNAIRRNKPND